MNMMKRCEHFVFCYVDDENIETTKPSGQKTEKRNQGRKNKEQMREESQWRRDISSSGIILSSDEEELVILGS